MKKMLAIALSLAMLMSTAAMAAGAGTNESAVTATYVDGNDSAPIVYSVKIDWEDLDFTYYEESHATWDPDTLTYNDDYQAEGWAEDSVANVTMSNRSNTDILATFSYTANEGFDSVDMNFAASQVYMASAEDGTEKTAANSVSPEGELPEGTDGEIGTITITIERCANITYDTANRQWATISAAITSMANGYSSQYGTYKMVESADEVESGTGYVLKADLVAFSNSESKAFDTYLQSIKNIELTPAQQSELNQKYYAYLAEWENFLATKCHIK